MKLGTELDPTNMKILSTMARIGPRNLIEVSRLTGIPFTTVYHRVAQMESKNEQVVHLLPNVSRLGMTRVIVFVAAEAGLEDSVTQALKIPNYWRTIERCEGDDFTHHSIQTIPTKYLKEFRQYVSTMLAKKLIKAHRIIETGKTFPIFPDFSSYDYSSGKWVFDWEGWLIALKNAGAEPIKDPRQDLVEVEKIDLEIIASLELDGRMKFTDIARKRGCSPQTVKYRYDNKLVPANIVNTFDFFVMPFPLEISSWHEFTLEFPEAASMSRFVALARKLFFIHQLTKALRKNTLLARTMIINSQVEKMFAFLSEMVNAGQLTSYSAVRLKMDCRISQTIPYELFDSVKGWGWDVYKNLLELNKL
jgi:DNA-binding Lrp family transcriptional regulator